MSGVVATAIVAHVPTLGLEKNIPDFQKNLPVAERAMGAALRAHLNPDLWVMVSSHWVATFDWLITAHARHTGVCVADEAPYLIPGVAYDYKGDPLFAATLAETLTAQGVPAALNESGHYHWDYGSFVPMQYLDPHGETPVVTMPSVVLSTIEESLRVGEAIDAAAKQLGRRAIVLASSALSHFLVRGRDNWPTPERIAADETFMNRFIAGDLDALVADLPDWARFVVAEMGGKPVATALGAAQAMAAGGRKLAGRRYGDYTRSSGSGNVVAVMADAEVIARLPA